MAFTESLNSNALVTLDAAKATNKIPDSVTTHDEILKLCINSASDDMETQTGIYISPRSNLIEFHSGRRSNQLIPKHYPIIAVNEIRVDHGGEFTDANTIVDSADYYIDEGITVVYRNRFFPYGVGNIKIDYDAGYSTIPSDIRMATLWLVSWYFNLFENHEIGRQSKSKGDESVSWVQKAPEYVRDTIARYKRTEIPADTQGIRNL